MNLAKFEKVQDCENGGILNNKLQFLDSDFEFFVQKRLLHLSCIFKVQWLPTFILMENQFQFWITDKNWRARNDCRFYSSK